jgi:hypothetical protein
LPLPASVEAFHRGAAPAARWLFQLPSAEHLFTCAPFKPPSLNGLVPMGLSRKLKIRAEEVVHLLRIRGCVLTRDVVDMGFTWGQAKYTLKHLVSAGRAVHILINGVSIWCYSRNSAVKHLYRLRRALHSALCRAGARFVAPRKALRILLSDEKASGIFSRYIRLSREDTAVKHLISGLLTLTYGNPVYHRKRPVYAVDCSRKKLPPLRLVDGHEDTAYLARRGGRSQRRG